MLVVYFIIKGFYFVWLGFFVIVGWKFEWFRVWEGKGWDKIKFKWCVWILGK